MAKEQVGPRKLWYDNGKKINCDYNRYNDYFIYLCLNDLRQLTIGNVSAVLDAIKQLCITVFLLASLALIIITFPISIPVRMLLYKRYLLKQHGDSLSYKYKEKK